jgi:hypothetical protein
MSKSNLHLTKPRRVDYTWGRGANPVCLQASGRDLVNSFNIPISKINSADDVGFKETPSEVDCSL